LGAHIQPQVGCSVADLRHGVAARPGEGLVPSSANPYSVRTVSWVVTVQELLTSAESPSNVMSTIKHQPVELEGWREREPRPARVGDADGGLEDGCPSIGLPDGLIRKTGNGVCFIRTVSWPWIGSRRNATSSARRLSILRDDFGCRVMDCAR